MTDKADLIEEVARHELAMLRLFARDRSAPLLESSLTMQQLKVVILLHIERSMSSHALADSLGVGLATVTGIVDRLVHRGLVCRTADPVDRRVRRVALTPEGQRLTEEMTAAEQVRRRRLLEQLDERTLADLARVMGEVHRVAEQMLREEEAGGA